MSEMDARKGLRARQNALANVFERLTLGLADADDVSELPHDVEGAIERGCAERIDGEVDTATLGEIKDVLFEIFVGRDDDTLSAEF